MLMSKWMWNCIWVNQQSDDILSTLYRVPTLWKAANSYAFPGFPKVISPKARAGKNSFGPIKLTNVSVQMACKGQSSLEIVTISYTYQACKTLFGSIKPINPSVRMACKGQSSFGSLHFPTFHILIPNHFSTKTTWFPLLFRSKISNFSNYFSRFLNYISGHFPNWDFTQI